MLRTSLTALSVVALLALAAVSARPATADAAPELTVATFNASLNRNAAGQLVSDLSTPGNAQARNAAETIQRSGADIILINEFDYVADGTAAALFRDNYLTVSQNGAPVADYPYYWIAPVNTGVPSGADLNNDGTVGGPDDAFGFGLFPGQYGMVVYSKYPIKHDQVRTFQNFLWKDMPGAKLPDDPATGAAADFYSPAELDIFRLSSKTHADIPIDVNGTTLHVLAAHPTPPSFDGPEMRNKLRNHDEIRIWADYIADTADYLYDDTGTTGGLDTDANFVILGDYNSDPNDGDSVPGSIQQLLNSPQVLDPMPTSEGAVEASTLQGFANLTHTSDPKYDTADFADDPRPGNLRVDYVLPSATSMTVSAAGVFWPLAADELSRLTGQFPFPTSDHRLVWARVGFVTDQTTPVTTPVVTTTPSRPTPTVASSTPSQTRLRPPALPNTGR